MRINRPASSTPMSSLFSLPPELRRCIIEYVVGNQFSHIEQLASLSLWTGRGISKSSYQFLGCVNTLEDGSCSDAPCHSITISDDDDEDDDDDDDDDDTESLAQQPFTCRTWTDISLGFGETARITSNIELSLLETCRQLYNEASYVLWTTNTFSFRSTVDLNHFISILSPSQASQIKSLHLSLLWDASNFENFESYRTASQLCKLKGLRNLRLCLKFHDRLGFTVSVGMDGSVCKKGQIEQMMSSPLFQALRSIPKDEVTVIISKYIQSWQCFGLPRWTAAEVIEAAKHLQCVLLDSTAAGKPEKKRKRQAEIKAEVLKRRSRDAGAYLPSARRITPSG